MASLSKEQQRCTHRKWKKTDQPNPLLRNEWHHQCADCGVMDYDLEEHRRKVDRLLGDPEEEESVRILRRIKHRTLHDIMRDIAAKQREMEKAKFRERCLQNPRWWLMLVPVIVMFLPLLFLQAVTKVLLEIATALHKGTSWICDKARVVSSWVLRWTHAKYKNANEEEV